MRAIVTATWILACAAPAAIVTLAMATAGCSARKDEPPADVILFNGTIVTLDPARPEAEAVALRGGTITAVGDKDAILALAGPETRRIDLRGGAAFPGLIDAHGHLRSLGDEIASLDVRGAASAGEIAARVRSSAPGLGPGEWVTGFGWDQNLWRGKSFPDHKPLTAAAPGRAVWLRRVDGHAGWASLEAMRLAGVTRDTPDPQGGLIVRDARGAPTGVFVDNAMDLISRAEPKPSREAIKASLRRALDRCARAGLTEVHDAGVVEEEVEAFREMADAGELPLRVYLMWSGMDGRPIEPLVAKPPILNYKNRLTLRAVKLMIDGAMGSRGAAFEADYADDKGNRGLLLAPEESIEKATETALRHGYQVCTHAIGDRGIRLTLDAYEKALAAVPATDPRLRIEHLQCVAQGDIPRLKRLGVIASMQPSHATSDMYWVDLRVGPERGKGLYAWRWVLDAGVPLAAGSDFPVDPERPLVGIHSAVTRQDLKNWPEGGWHPEQRMTLDEALRAYTSGAAYAAFEEDRKGRIAPGYWADLTVLSRDLRSAPPADIPDTAVRYTIVGGSIVYEAP